MLRVWRSHSPFESIFRASSCTRSVHSTSATATQVTVTEGQQYSDSSDPHIEAGGVDLGPSQEVQELICREVLRSSIVAENAAAGLYHGQQCVLGGIRPDIKAFREREQQHLERLQKLAPQRRTRPSLLSPIVSTGFFALGAATAVLPQHISAAVTGGLQEALIEAYNDNLRQMREVGLSTGEVREVVKAVRDEERTVEGSPQVPDISFLMQKDNWNNVNLEEGISALAKVGTATLVNAARKL